MVADLLIARMDYVYFLYGLAFVLLAGVSVIIRREDPRQLAWLHFGLFGLCHGMFEWMEMIVLQFGDTTAFAVVRLALLVASFVFLIEFGRRGGQGIRGWRPGAWIYLPLALGVVLGAREGLTGLNATTRYFLGLIGGLWAAWTLMRAARGGAAGAGWLRVAASVLGAYAVITGAIVSETAFLPAASLNTRAFLSVAGFPVQVARAALAVLISVALWASYQCRLRQAMAGIAGSTPYHGLQMAVSLLLTLLGGLVATERVGRHEDADIRDTILSYSRVAAAVLDPETVRAINDPTSEWGPRAEKRLREQLTEMHDACLQFRWVHLLALNAKNNVQALISVPPGRKGHGLPVDNAYQPPPKELFTAFSGVPALAGPYTDETGTFISGFAPVKDFTSGRTVAVVALDLDARRWRRNVAEFRLTVIAVTFVISLMLIGFFVERQRLWDSAAQIQRLNATLEHRVRDRTAELTEAYGELESFMYSVSHDLRAPLRHVNGFVNLLKSVLPRALDPQASIYLTNIDRASARMAVLIDDLLAFARVGRVGLQKAPVDLGRLLDEVLADLAPDTKGRRIEWNIGALPTVLGDAALLRQVLHNLIGNAIKFTRPRDPAIIEVGSTGTEEWVIFVRDNGVGFDPAYAGKLFGVFERLHAPGLFEGTGVGLALVRRIVQRHGGRTWAESVVGQGATFYFSLPKG